MPVRQIYIVDDDPAAALITQRGLQTMLGERFSVWVAPSPNAAWLSCAMGNVDLLIVDPNPHTNGALSLIRVAQAFRPDIPVLVLTAYDTPGLRARMRELGVDRYVAKPIELRELVPIVKAIMPPEHMHPVLNGPSLATLSLSSQSGK
ncbi:response regulator transcription factor [Candidatus Chloroploca sp. Khr17]|uniref:response regulator transcription factor n=1 Tax=Candidatus Chloroploca sp. Khr17 TaxID=2496869 RepID=UPI00101C27B0|nr:response regulator [Candidatus Chloroploca sp. Khr17]